MKPLPQPQPWSSIDRLVLKVLAEKYQKTLGFDTEVLQSLDSELRHSVGDVDASDAATLAGGGSDNGAPGATAPCLHRRLRRVQGIEA
ncbi:hypothetical protein MY10362_004599 [Beauveria mimosiformis]